jgi:hypothetical protein
MNAHTYWNNGFEVARGMKTDVNEVQRNDLPESIAMDERPPDIAGRDASERKRQQWR